MASEKKEGWINIYKRKCVIWSNLIYKSEEDAKKKIDGDNYVATIKIEWEE